MRIDLINISPKALSWLIASSVSLAILLSETYSLLKPYTSEAWIAAAIVNSILSVGIIIILGKNLIRFMPKAGEDHSRHDVPSWMFYIPGVIILLGTGFLILLSHFFVDSELRPSENISTSHWSTYALFILWIPLIEELVFRVGVGNLLRKIGGKIWGSYFSALLFSLVHSHPTLLNMLGLKISLPLGPLLLGLVAETLYVFSGKRLGPIIFFHAVCNGTTVLFLLGDARWLNWLNFLYL